MCVSKGILKYSRMRTFVINANPKFEQLNYPRPFPCTDDSIAAKVTMVTHVG